MDAWADPCERVHDCSFEYRDLENFSVDLRLSNYDFVKLTSDFNIYLPERLITTSLAQCV